MTVRRDDGVSRDLAFLLIIAAALRFAAPRSFGLDHFDESAYAMTAAALAHGQWPGGIYPLQHYLSPPLFFGLSAALMRAGGLQAQSLFWISAVAGVATVAIVYLAGRRWFGRAAAGAAALIVTLSDFHVLYSRAGLTDILFAALLVLAVWLFAEAEDRRSLPLAALAGMVTGLAWNTKYHGWLAAVVATAAVVPRLVARERPPWLPTVIRLAVASGVAAAMYVPWALYVEDQPGGYARLTLEHARFLRPLRAFQSAVMQVDYQRYLEGWLARLTPLAICAWIMWVEPRARRRDGVLIAAVLTLASFALGSTMAIGLLALCGVALLLGRHGLDWSRHWYAIALFAVFTVLTPLYRPYARLLLPWFMAAAFLAGVSAQAALTTSTRRRWRPYAAALAGLFAVLIVARGLPEAASPWRDRTSLRTATEELAAIAPEPLPFVVLGEPGVVQYLRENGREAWVANRPRDTTRHVPAGGAYYLVGGIYSRRLGGEDSHKEWLAQHPEVTLVGHVRVADVSDVRLLDDFSPPGARRFRQDHTGEYDLNVYRGVAAASERPR